MVARTVLLPLSPDGCGRTADTGSGRAGTEKGPAVTAGPFSSVLRRQMARTVSACGPFAPWLASKETRWFSSRVRNPSDWMAE